MCSLISAFNLPSPGSIWTPVELPPNDVFPDKLSGSITSGVLHTRSLIERVNEGKSEGAEGQENQIHLI